MISVYCVCAVTHVVTVVSAEGSCPRTIKYLQAVLAGIWILDLRCKCSINVTSFSSHLLFLFVLRK